MSCNNHIEQNLATPIREQHSSRRTSIKHIDNKKTELRNFVHMSWLVEFMFCVAVYRFLSTYQELCSNCYVVETGNEFVDVTHEGAAAYDKRTYIVSKYFHHECDVSIIISMTKCIIHSPFILS